MRVSEVAGKIPQAVIDEVLSRTSIVDLIDNYVPLTKRGKSYLACCPFHQEKTPSFNVIPHKQFYYCFGCGASGNAISFLMAHQKHDFVSAVELLASRAGLKVPLTQGASPEQTRRRSNAFELLAGITTHYQHALAHTAKAKQYLAGRGLSGETIETFKLGYATPGWDGLLSAFRSERETLEQTGMLVKNDKGHCYDRYRNRIMFPIEDKRGRVVGFGGRSLEDTQKPKYLNSPETAYFHKSSLLYGYAQLASGALEHILLVEGYMDVIGLYQHGIHNAVATLGTATSTHHIQQLLRRTSKLICCFDGDEAGQRAALKALTVSLPLLQEGQVLTFVFLPEQHDPDSWVRMLGKAAFMQKLTEAMSMEVFMFEQITQGLSLETTEGQLQCVARARDWFSIIQQAQTFKMLMVERLAALTRLPRDQVITLLRGKPDEAADKVLPRPPRARPKLSAMRKALALLVQHPQQLASIALPQALKESQHEGVALLMAIHGQLKPGESTAQLVEYWRDRPEYRVISQLVMLPLSIPESGVLVEFQGALQQIVRSDLQKQVDGLLYKARTMQLSQEERTALQSMIKVLKTKDPTPSATHG